MRGYIEEKQKQKCETDEFPNGTVYIFGAGASYAASNKRLPLGADVMFELFTRDLSKFIIRLRLAGGKSKTILRANKADLVECLREMRRMNKARDPLNFEEVCDHAANYRRSYGEYSKAEKTILVGLYHLLKPRKNIKYHMYSQFLKRLRSNDTVATINYDTLLDMAILKKYGAINYGFLESEITNIGKKPLKYNPQLVPLLKLHGSFNWGNANMAKLGKKDAIVAISQKFVPPSENGRGFVNPGTDKRMTEHKYLLPLWHIFSERLRTCDRIVIIGSSFMKENNDNHLKQLVSPYSYKIQGNEKDFKKWLERTKRYKS